MTKLLTSSHRILPTHGKSRVVMQRVLAVLFGLVMASCASSGPVFPEPLRAAKSEAAAETLGAEQTTQSRVRPRLEEGPTASAAPVLNVDRQSLPKLRSSKPVTLTLDAVNLTAFINEVFATQLGFSLEIDQAVRERTEQVSLRLVEPESPERLYLIAREVLARYGVAIEQGSGLLRFVVAAADAVEPPKLLRGRTVPEDASAQSSVFVVVPLNVSQPGRIGGQVRSLFGDQPALKLAEMVESNALLVSGPPVVVQAAIEAIALFDQVALRDKHSLRVNPMYIGADVLAKELSSVLVGQGYSVSTGPGSGGVITVVPVPSANALILFSESREALDAATRWVESLDQPGDENAGDGGVYLYAARHTTVDSLKPVVEALIGGVGSSSGAASADAAKAAPAASGVSANGNQVVIDPVRNTIIFQGDAQRWRALQGVLARLDQPARQVMIEVTVAEVTLTDEFSHGVEWAFRNAGISNFEGPLTALTGAGEGNSGGVIWRPLSSSGQVRAVLNAFASKSEVSILSTPRLMVRSGETASIDVGTEVPIITSQATAPDLQQGGNSSFLQQVQYRKTGVLLEIEAVVHSGQRVDLDITQEVSEARATDTSDIASPSIFSRKLKTALSLSDGDSMLLGGLISKTESSGGSEVPGLGRIPVLGKLFQNKLHGKQRTELLLLITPYVVEDAAQARDITEAIRRRFEDSVTK